MQADCLRALAVAESRQTAAHARMLRAFSVPGGGLQGDGHRSPRMWLSWQTQATGKAAAAKVAWMRRLEAHPMIAAALADGRVPESRARLFCDWSDRLPEAVRADADGQFLAASDRGADLVDLAALAEDLHRRHASCDEDQDGFADRAVRLGKTFGGAGRLEGDLTARCAAVVEAVLDALGTPAGPEDDRTVAQRYHDALEEACTRLIAAGLLPQRAGQPVRLELEITLAELLANAGGLGCDALVQPVITGHVDYDLLAQLANGGSDPGDPLAGPGDPGRDGTAGPDAERDADVGSDSDADTGCVSGADTGSGSDADAGRVSDADDAPGSDAEAAAEAARAALAGACAAAVRDGRFGDVLAAAVALLSGPAGRAAALRRKLAGGPAVPVSLPLDIPGVFDTIPVHLRRAVRKRDKHCRFPGCDQPVAACDVHHLIHRKDGGRHALTNLLLMCRFHHLIAIHRWGWRITLHADGTTTAVSPDGAKTLHSHAPPIRAA